jgi:hypothetical protein
MELSVSQLRGTLTLSWVSIPTMSDDRNPPREDRVLAMPNIVPATASVFSEHFLCYAQPFPFCVYLMLISRRNTFLSARGFPTIQIIRYQGKYTQKGGCFM